MYRFIFTQSMASSIFHARRFDMQKHRCSLVLCFSHIFAASSLNGRGDLVQPWETQAKQKLFSRKKTFHLWFIVSYCILTCSCFLFQNLELTMLLFTRCNKNSENGEKILARTCHCYSSLINLLRSWASIFARSFVKGDGDDQQILNLRDQWFGTYTSIQW